MSKQIRALIKEYLAILITIGTLLNFIGGVAWSLASVINSGKLEAIEYKLDVQIQQQQLILDDQRRLKTSINERIDHINSFLRSKYPDYKSAHY